MRSSQNSLMSGLEAQNPCYVRTLGLGDVLDWIELAPAPQDLFVGLGDRELGWRVESRRSVPELSA